MGVWHRFLSRFFSPDEPHAAEPQVDLETNLPLEEPISESLLKAISTDDLPTLRAILETQDRQLFSQIAQNGTPETAAYLLSRHLIPEDYSQYVLDAHPTLNPTQYLIRESARCGNVPVFDYLLTQYPSLLTANNQNAEKILVNAMTGGVDIWKIILEHRPSCKDHEFGGHHGTTLENVIYFKKMELLEFLLQEGADTVWDGGAALNMARFMGVERETRELIKKYSG